MHTKEKEHNIYSIAKLVASTNTVLPLDEILYYVTIMTIIADNQIIQPEYKNESNLSIQYSLIQIPVGQCSTFFQHVHMWDCMLSSEIP